MKLNEITFSRRQALALMTLILLLSSALRMVSLERSPPGFLLDEACEGYDAYSIWHTGRDHHGVLLPTVMRSFNDYRSPLFIYSMAPIVGTAGLSVTTARLTAAFWGILAVAAAYRVGAQLFGRAPSLVAALFLAISPWYVPVSRIAHESNTTVLTMTLIVGMLWHWQRSARHRWVIGAAVVSGLGIYAYAVTKLSIPVMVAALGLLFGRTVVKHYRWVLVAAVVGTLLAIPMICNTLRYPGEMQARYHRIAVLQRGHPPGESIEQILRNAWNSFSPQYLFTHGDTDQVRHPKGTGQLYPPQALLIVVGIIWGIKQREVRFPLAVVAIWILSSTLPSLLTQTNALRSLPAVVPWQLLSGLGMVTLVNLLRTRATRLAITSVILAWVGVNAVDYFAYYFTRYPADVSRSFNVGIREAVTAMDALDDEYDAVYFNTDASTYLIYIDILFFTRYDPHLLQSDLPQQEKGLFAPVLRVGKYHTIPDAEDIWNKGLPGLFVVPADAIPEVPPLKVITDTNGSPMFKIIGRHFFPYNIDKLEWFTQCTQPVPPLNAETIAKGRYRDNLRYADFDCTSAWLYPVEGSGPGAYVLHYYLMSQASFDPTGRPQASDPFIARHLVNNQLAFNMPEFTLEFPGFVIYEQTQPPIIPAPSRLVALPATASPHYSSAFTTPVTLDGPLTFLGAAAYPENGSLDVETWWRITDGNIVQPFSIMGHLLTEQGDVLGVADGLGVFPPVLMTEDVFVQRHRFPTFPEGDKIWLRTGAYWLNTMERWNVVGVEGADALFVPLDGYSPDQ